MRHAVLLNGARKGESMLDPALAVVLAELAEEGWTTRHFELRTIPIAPCAGCFGCWVKTPGECVTRDANHEVTAATIDAALMVLLTPIVFGGYSSELKKAIDHQIPLVSPFFRRIGGEVHHQPRYRQYPDVLAIGVQAVADPEPAALFTTLVERHALNLQARRSSSLVWPAATPVTALTTGVRHALASYQEVAA